MGWPGFGPTPSNPRVGGMDDLVSMVVAKLDRPTALVAQSMGGAIALRAVLARPERVTHLVLTATSGGIDVARLGGEDWRPAFHAANPQLPGWFSTYSEDLSGMLPQMHIPALLLWGDADAISPVRVGEKLASLLPFAQLHVIQAGDHDLAETHSEDVARLIDAFLAT